MREVRVLFYLSSQRSKRGPWAIVLYCVSQVGRTVASSDEEDKPKDAQPGPREWYSVR
jgi:hypothetical protein